MTMLNNIITLMEIRRYLKIVFIAIGIVPLIINEQRWLKMAGKWRYNTR